MAPVVKVSHCVSPIAKFEHASELLTKVNSQLSTSCRQNNHMSHLLCCAASFSKFYRRHYELVSKFSVDLKTLLHQGLSEPEFYGDLVYKLKKKCR